MTQLTHKVQYNKGAAMLIAVIFFLSISLTIVIGIATPILKQVKDSTELINSKETFYLANGALEDAVYRIQANKTVSTGDTVSYNGGTATISTITTGTGKTLTATANFGGRIRKIQTSIFIGVGTSFNYGVQSGNGGFILDNSSGVNGNVYSNGDIIGSNGAFITGTAVAANSAALTTDQSNGTAGTPPNSITFRNASASQDIAQSFQVSTTSQVNKVRFYIKKVGSPANATVRIVNDSSGSPGTTVLDTGTLGDGAGAAGVTTSFGWVSATFSSNADLVGGTTYWLVIDNGGSYSSSNYYVLAADSGYATGIAKIGKYSTRTWGATSPSDLDEYFEIYLGGILSTIDNVDVGTGSVGDAHAHTVTNSTIYGKNYCQVGSGNNKVCDTSEEDPAPVGYPISDANIAQWKSEAEAGGVITGDYTVSTNVTLGPKKIVGNLIVNGTLTVTGTIWVTGNITGANGAMVKLDSQYGNTSGVIINDGYVDLSNNMQFSGVAGQSNTYVMILTTNTCPYTSPCAPNNSAIYLGNNAGAVILNAQVGKLHLKNGASASEATAYLIELDPNAIISYSTGLASQIFSSGPSGGWNIGSWQEVQ